LRFREKNLGQLGVNAMVNATTMEKQRHRQWANNEKQPSNEHKQYETTKNNAQTTKYNAITQVKEGF